LAGFVIVDIAAEIVNHGGNAPANEKTKEAARMRASR
jgi:hypothetical protein